MLLALVAMLSAAPRAHASEDYELSRVGPTPLSLEVGGALLLLGTSLLLPIPEQCRWCNPPGFDDSLARPALPEARRTAGRMSHLFSFLVLPTLSLSALAVPALSTSEPDDHAYQNVAIAVEVLAVDLALTLAVKRWVARRRPAFYYRRTHDTEYAHDSPEANVSFFSGDTSAAFATASAAATISFQRGYRSAPYVTAAGASFALATGLLRMSADVHWASDVLTGALVGTGLGLALPLLLHPRLSQASESAASARSGFASAGTSEPAMLRFSGAF